MAIQEIITRMKEATNDELNLSLIKELEQELSKDTLSCVRCGAILEPLEKKPILCEDCYPFYANK